MSPVLPRTVRYEQHPLDVCVAGIEQPVGRVASILYEDDRPTRLVVELFDGNIVVTPPPTPEPMPTGRSGPVRNTAGAIIGWWGR